MPKIKELEKIEENTKKVLKEKNSSKSKTSKKTKAKKAETTKKISAASKKSDSSKTAKKEVKEKNNKLKKETIKKAVRTAKIPAKKPKKELKQEYLQEYYDLPYRYNETVVKILAQTPKRLFVYWEISEKDRETYLNAFGEDFFEKTYPVLLVHNEEMNYTFEVPINDFANSWYLDIQDPKTKYVVQLGRKFRNIQDIRPVKEIIEKENINLQNDYIEITNSNELEAPNDHVLFESLGNQVTYRNVKNGYEFKKDISSVIEKLSKSYKDADIKEIYRELYGEEISEDILSNPSSGSLSSSSFK